MECSNGKALLIDVMSGKSTGAIFCRQCKWFKNAMETKGRKYCALHLHGAEPFDGCTFGEVEK